MSNFAIGLWSFPVLLALIFLRIPIGLAMFVVGFGGNSLIHGSIHIPLAQLKHLAFGAFSNYSLSIIPLFLLMGQFATLSGMSKALFEAAKAWLGHHRGGMPMAAIGASAGFGAICGSSLATAATMGQIILPELRRHSVSPRLAAGTLAAGGTLGILIPPSLILVIYAILTEQNIAKLFIAAMFPGLLAVLSYMLTIAIVVRITPQTDTHPQRLPYKARLRALIPVWPVLTVFLIVIGGIYTGLFTPTEAAAIGAFATGLIAIWGRALNWDKLRRAILATATTTGMIFFILLGAAVLNSFLALTQLPQELVNLVSHQNINPWLILLGVLLLYLVLGFVMDSLSMILLTVPILFPIMASLDFGLTGEEFALWFGILVLIMVELGLITPPVGLNLFIIHSQDQSLKLADIYRGVLPFIMADILRIGLLILCPTLTLFAVNWFY